MNTKKPSHRTPTLPTKGTTAKSKNTPSRIPSLIPRPPPSRHFATSSISTPEPFLRSTSAPANGFSSFLRVPTSAKPAPPTALLATRACELEPKVDSKEEQEEEKEEQEIVLCVVDGEEEDNTKQEVKILERILEVEVEGDDDYPLLVSPSFMSQYDFTDLHNALNEIPSPSLPSPPLTTTFLTLKQVVGEPKQHRKPNSPHIHGSHPQQLSFEGTDSLPPTPPALHLDEYINNASPTTNIAAFLESRPELAVLHTKTTPFLTSARKQRKQIFPSSSSRGEGGRERREREEVDGEEDSSDILRTPPFPEIQSSTFLRLAPSPSVANKNRRGAKRTEGGRGGLGALAAENLQKERAAVISSASSSDEFVPMTPSDNRGRERGGHDMIASPAFPSPPRSTPFLRVAHNRHQLQEERQKEREREREREEGILRTPELPNPVTTPLFRLTRSHLVSSSSSSPSLSSTPAGTSDALSSLSPSVSTPPLPSPPRSTVFLRLRPSQWNREDGGGEEEEEEEEGTFTSQFPSVPQDYEGEGEEVGEKENIPSTSSSSFQVKTSFSSFSTPTPTTPRPSLAIQRAPIEIQSLLVATPSSAFLPHPSRRVITSSSASSETSGWRMKTTPHFFV